MQSPELQFELLFLHTKGEGQQLLQIGLTQDIQHIPLSGFTFDGGISQIHHGIDDIVLGLQVFLQCTEDLILGGHCLHIDVKPCAILDRIPVKEIDIASADQIGPLQSAQMSTQGDAAAGINCNGTDLQQNLASASAQGSHGIHRQQIRCHQVTGNDHISTCTQRDIPIRDQAASSFFYIEITIGCQGQACRGPPAERIVHHESRIRSHSNRSAVRCPQLHTRTHLSEPVQISHIYGLIILGGYLLHGIDSHMQSGYGGTGNQLHIVRHDPHVLAIAVGNGAISLELDLPLGCEILI